MYRELAVNRSFAEAMAAAIRRKDTRAVRIMVRRLVKTKSLKSVTIEESGIALLFKTRFSKYPYRNLFISGSDVAYRSRRSGLIRLQPFSDLTSLEELIQAKRPNPIIEVEFK
ncbi:hypothetical protein ACFSQ7_29370 [Paenibacillus rhizoplanae]